MILLPLMIVWARRPMHFTKSSRWSLLVIAFVGLCWLGPLANQQSTAQSSLNSATTAEKNRERHREGSRLTALVGTFTPAGRRWTFVADSGDLAYLVLENRSLERVAKAIAEDPQDRHWKISGELTEYFDDNYLLIERIERAIKATND